MSLLRRVFFAVLFVNLTFVQAWAVTSLKAQCFLMADKSDRLDGVNVDERYPIASVSKVMTAYWAIATMGAAGRFQTLLHIRDLGNGVHDLHFQGTRDPYFSKQALQFVIAELNQKGIRKIRDLTFDENFKFLVDPKSVAATHLDNPDPLSPRVRSHLRLAFDKLSAGYPELRGKVKALEGMNLPEKIQMSVERIEFLGNDEFDAQTFSQSYVYRSAPVAGILKEMNRNSNNYSANNVFESLGGADRFHEFIEAQLGLGRDALHFVNGSGDRKDLASGESIYNEASCRAVLLVIQALRQELRQHGLGLQDVMAVAGRNAPGERSTAELYKNDETESALIAKTGTVNPAITLAGMVSTEEGNIFFGYIYKTGGAGDAPTARSKIRMAVTKLIREHGGRDPLSVQIKPFLPFDRNSTLTIRPVRP